MKTVKNRIQLNLKVNGEARILEAGGSVLDLLSSMQIDPRRIACEVNLSIVRRADLAQKILEDGDSVEIVQIMGGG